MCSSPSTRTDQILASSFLLELVGPLLLLWSHFVLQSLPQLETEPSFLPPDADILHMSLGDNHKDNRSTDSAGSEEMESFALASADGIAPHDTKDAQRDAKQCLVHQT